MLITLESIDNMGKTTLAKELATQLSGAVFTKEPGCPFIAVNKRLRELVLHNKELSAFERELLFYADASQHRRWMEHYGKDLIISDRGLWSHLAYAYGTLKSKKMTYEEYGLCKQVIKQTVAQPNAVIFFNSDLNLMEERMQGEADVIEGMGREFYTYVSTMFDDLVIATELNRTPLLKLNPRDSLATNVTKSIEFISSLTKA